MLLVLIHLRTVTPHYNYSCGLVAGAFMLKDYLPEAY